MGTEIDNQALASVLQEKTELNNDDLIKFQLSKLSCDSYIKVGHTYFKPERGETLVDNLLNCNIAWFHHVLKGDGDLNTTQLENSRKQRGLDGHVPLYKAVVQALAAAEPGTVDVNDNQTLHVATRSQVDDMAHFIADRYWQDIFLLDKEARETSDSYL